MLINCTWNESPEIKKEHKNLKINQIYCWIKSVDNKVILVTKDNKKWQFPWWHPEFWEDYKSTLQREIFEETGLDISNYLDKLDFFDITI